MPTDTMQTKRKRVRDALESEYDTTVGGDKRARLRVVTDIGKDSDDTLIFEELSAVDSLFDEPNETLMHAARPSGNRLSGFQSEAVNLTSRTVPPIPGLFAPSVLLPLELADGTMRKCMDKYFRDEGVNQVMLFGRAHPPSTSSNSQSGIPPFLT